MESLPAKKHWLGQLPNQLTLARIAAIPVLLALYPIGWQPIKVICAFIFAIAALTDILDGYLARRNSQVTPMGALLDPLADKLLTTAALILIVNEDTLWTWMAGVLVCRDIGITSLRMVAQEQGITISVSGYGKLKSIFQDIMIFCLMVNDSLLDIPLKAIGWGCAWVALALSVYSAYLYVLEFWEKTKPSESPRF